MIDALIAGRVMGAPTARTSKTGKPFATARLRVAMRGDTTMLVSVITFSGSAVTALLALNDGDSVALAGELTPKIWTDKDGKVQPALDLLAHAVLSPYAVQRKRAASRAAKPAAQTTADTTPFDDPLPPP